MVFWPLLELLPSFAMTACLVREWQNSQTVEAIPPPPESSISRRSRPVIPVKPVLSKVEGTGIQLNWLCFFNSTSAKRFCFGFPGLARQIGFVFSSWPQRSPGAQRSAGPTGFVLCRGRLARVCRGHLALDYQLCPAIWLCFFSPAIGGYSRNPFNRMSLRHFEPSANWLCFFNCFFAIRITQYPIRNKLALFFQKASPR